MAEELLAVEEARSRILELCGPLPAELVAVDVAMGRGLSEPVLARRTVPPWDNSAMDGYAVRAADVAQAPVRLTVAEEIPAGRRSARMLGPGEAARIFTGAPLPPGADAVVMQERTRRPSGSEVEILEPVTARTFVRDAGEDARAGELLLAPGTALGIPEAGLLWSQGITQVRVPRRPKVAILATGDELCAPEDAGPDSVVDTNSRSLAEAVRRAGGEPTLLGIARDRLEDVVALLQRAQGFDAVLTSAGVSVGERDFVRPALEQLGVEMRFWKVAIKPGKPLAVGRKDGTVYFGIPGNPTSSLVTFELFVRPALRRMIGSGDVQPERSMGRLDGQLKKQPGLTHYVRVTSTWRDGALWVRPLASQTSGALRSASAATHLLEFPAEQAQLSSGDAVGLLNVHWTA